MFKYINNNQNRKTNMKNEKTKQNALKSQSEDPRYNKWVGHCKEEADESGFKGLLFAYLSGHDSVDYNKLVVGAVELLSDVHCRLIDNSDEYDNPEVYFRLEVPAAKGNHNGAIIIGLLWMLPKNKQAVVVKDSPISEQKDLQYYHAKLHVKIYNKCVSVF